MPEVLILTGPPGAGKTTVAQALAERYDRVAHIQVDVLRHFITATGFVGAGRPGFERQAGLGVRNACAIALNFLAQRIAVIVDDVVLTPEDLAAYVEALQPGGVPVHYVRLLPSLDACLERNRQRKTDRVRRERVEEVWRAFEAAGDIGGATIDSSQLTTYETADRLQAFTTSGASIVWQPGQDVHGEQITGVEETQERSGSARHSPAVLIILAGLPGTGKTSIARELARQTGATHVRIDTIEQAIRASGLMNAQMNDAGYRVAYALAADNLGLGHSVIADSVNPLAITRESWRAVAAGATVRVLEVELICSDLDEHRRRIESRSTDIAGLKLPTWQQVASREYEPWLSDHLVLDTAHQSVEDNVAVIREALSQL